MNWRSAPKITITYFQIAMNYGSRDEILRGMTRMIEDVKNGTLAENAFDENGKLTEQCFESYLDTAGIPDQIF